jgi:hypothetical protein
VAADDAVLLGQVSERPRQISKRDISKVVSN